MTRPASARLLSHRSGSRLIAALLGFVVLAAACGSTTTDATTDHGTSGQPEASASAIDTLAAALGDIESTSGYQYVASGSRHEPGQGHRLGDVVEVSAFDVAVTTDLGDRRLRLDWVRIMGEQTVVPNVQLAYSEVVTTEAGYIDGNDAVFEIGSSRPMNSARLAAVRRQQLVLQPHLALAEALQEDHEIEFTAGNVIEIDDPRGAITLHIDPVTGDLFQLATTESDPLTGDVDLTVQFRDWAQVGDLRMAAIAELAVDGIVVHREARSGFDTAPIAASAFVLTETVEVDHAGFNQGWTNSQWFNRGLALPFGAGFVDQTLDAPVDVVRINDEVVVVAGTRHNSVLVDIGDSVVMIEPSINADRSKQLLEVAATEFGEPVSHVVLTHDHYDQIGGVRGAVVEGAVVVAPASDLGFIQSVLTSERLVDPDPLSFSSETVIVEAVDESWATTGGHVTAHRFRSIHDQDMLLVCIPQAGLAFNSDLFNPGFGPPDAPLPEPQRTFAVELLAAITTNCPSTTGVLGSHGAPSPAGIDVLTANAGID